MNQVNLNQDGRQVKIGDSVIFVDSLRSHRPALVTATFGPCLYNEVGELVDAMCINVVFVSSDPEKHDSWGRQMERFSSVPSVLRQSESIGMCWKFAN